MDSPAANLLVVFAGDDRSCPLQDVDELLLVRCSGTASASAASYAPPQSSRRTLNRDAWSPAAGIIWTDAGASSVRWTRGPRRSR